MCRVVVESWTDCLSAGHHCHPGSGHRATREICAIGRSHQARGHIKRTEIGSVARDSSTMKDKLKNQADTLKGLIKTGGNVMDKALDKGGEVAVLMIDNMAKLTSKLSDDVGLMAERILKTEEQIGKMADRIVHTEELIAKLTATLANRELDSLSAKPPDPIGSAPPLLSIRNDRIDADAVPELEIMGSPQDYVLYVSSSPLFREDDTVVSWVTSADDLPGFWRRSISSFHEARETPSGKDIEPKMVSVAVRVKSGSGQLSPLSNSVDLTVG